MRELKGVDDTGRKGVRDGQGGWGCFETCTSKGFANADHRSASLCEVCQIVRRLFYLA
jgi:hypothetical protein